MAGAYRVLLSRAEATVTAPDGKTETMKAVTVAVRDGQATIKLGREVLAEMPATDLAVSGRKAFTVTGPDGTTWAVRRRCGCGGGR